MHDKFLMLVFIILVSSFSSSLAMPNTLKQVRIKITLIKKEFSNKLIINSIIVENKKQKSLSEIMLFDKTWKNSVGIPDFIKKYLTSTCAKHLKKIQNKYNFIAELFVMDNKGALVCASNKTSDYWQGDEMKWIKAFNNGDGKDFYDNAVFDDSTQAYLIQVSIPIFNKNNTIGTATIGIDLDKLE